MQSLKAHTFWLTSILKSSLCSTVRESLGNMIAQQIMRWKLNIGFGNQAGKKKLDINLYPSKPRPKMTTVSLSARGFI